jgi:hypothetical protein
VLQECHTIVYASHRHTILSPHRHVGTQVTNRVALLLQACYKNVKKVLQMCYRGVAVHSSSRWCDAIVAAMLLKCYRGVIGVLQGCYRGVTGVCRDSSITGVSKGA